MTVRFRLPRKLKVGARTLTVKSCQRFGREDDADGDFDAAAGVIRVRTGLKPERRLQVFLEECLHAIEDDRGIEIPHRKIEQFALGLAAMHVDNGWKIGS